MDIQELVEKLKPYKPEKIIFFGSQAYGEPHEDSDLDVAIIKDTDKPFHDRLIEVRKLVWTTTPIDFLVFTPDEFESMSKNSLFINEIKKRGKVVYEQ